MHNGPKHSLFVYCKAIIKLLALCAPLLGTLLLMIYEYEM
jgi:hypothetical protein